MLITHSLLPSSDSLRSSSLYSFLPPHTHPAVLLTAYISSLPRHPQPEPAQLAFAMHDAASTSPPRRKRSAKSMAVSDDEDPAGEGLKRVSIACTTCRKR